MSWRGIFRKAGINIENNTFTFDKNKDMIVRLRSSLTTGSIRGIYNILTLTGESTDSEVEGIKSQVVVSDVKHGSWINAITGAIDFSTSGSPHGMAASICAEMVPPAGSLVRGGLYALDMCFGCPSAASWGNAGPVAFMRFENWGTKSHFSANAFLFHLVGETGAGGALLSANERTLKVLIGSTTKFIYLSDTEDDLGAVYGDSIVLSTAVAIPLLISATVSDTGLDISGTCTNFGIDISGGQTAVGIGISGACGTFGLLVSGACLTAGIGITGAEAIALLISTSTPTYGISITAACETAGIHVAAGSTLGLDIQSMSRIGTHNWGAASGIAPSATGGILEVAGSIATDITAGAYASIFGIMAVTNSIAGDVSVFGAWHEMYVTGDLTIARSNYAATWSMINLAHASGSLTFNAAGTQPTNGATWLAGHTIVFKASSGVVLGAGRLAAGLFVQGEIEGPPSIDGDAKLCGILITVNSPSGAYMEPWPVGLEIADEASIIGIKIGDHAANAILVECSTGATGLIDIYVNSTYTLATQDTNHECARFAMTYTPAGGSGTTGNANLTACMNYLNIDADLDGTSYMSCLSGLLYFTTDGELNCANGLVTALKGELCVRAGGVITTGNICILHLHCNTAVDIKPASGVSAYIYCDGNAASAGCGMQTVMSLMTHEKTDFFLSMSNSWTSGMLASNSSADAWTHRLAVQVDGATRYIKLSSQ